MTRNNDFDAHRGLKESSAHARRKLPEPERMDGLGVAIWTIVVLAGIFAGWVVGQWLVIVVEQAKSF
jgi:hypothetical protein